jgi:nitrogen-specific signal transduction histidine kinase
MENQVLITLKNNKLFSNIITDDIDFSNINGSFISVHEGEILFRERAKSNLLYLVVSGEINLLTKQANSKAQSLIFTDNDFFGCEEFLAGIPRKSTAVALRDSYLIALTKEEVDSLVNQNYDILNNIYASIPENDDESITPSSENKMNQEIVTPEIIVNETPTEILPHETETKEIYETEKVINEEPIESEINLVSEIEKTLPDTSAEIPNESYELPQISEEPVSEPELPKEDNSENNISIPTDEIPSEKVQKEEDFNFNERFGLNDSFLDEFQKSAEPQINEESVSPEIKEEANSFLDQDFKFYQPEETAKPADDFQNQKTNIEKESTDIKTEENTKEPHMNIEGEYFPTIEHLQKINEAAGLVNTNIKIDDILKNIVNVACDLTSADRGTLYFVDKEKNELWSKVAMGSEFREIKLKIGEGIAGWVAKSGEIINLENVREDPRFNASFDKSSGYETKNMICFPIKSQNGEVVGVLQLLNSKKNKFNKIDEEFLKALSTHIALAFRNANMVENLLSNERVSSLGKMANFLIQDIKKPILVSKRYAEHLKSKQLSEDVVKIVDMLLEQLNHIADLIQSTLSYSEGQIILRSVVRNLNEVLDDFIARIDGYVGSRNCKINKKYDANVNVKISEKQFYQAFEHIIKNACDAMPEGGDIQIQTQKSGNNILIMISDAGLGIPESLHQKIFEPFMSLGKRDATGLGLSITKKIIEEHGGTISVKSQMGEGATFTISFPIIFSY